MSVIVNQNDNHTFIESFYLYRIIIMQIYTDIPDLHGDLFSCLLTCKYIYK